MPDLALGPVRAARQVIDDRGTAVAPKPVNLLINAPFITVAAAVALGVRRISAGGTLARTTWAGLLASAHEIATNGTFQRFVGLPDVDALLSGGDPPR